MGEAEDRIASDLALDLALAESPYKKDISTARPQKVARRETRGEAEERIASELAIAESFNQDLPLLSAISVDGSQPVVQPAAAQHKTVEVRSMISGDRICSADTQFPTKLIANLL